MRNDKLSSEAQSRIAEVRKQARERLNERMRSFNSTRPVARSLRAMIVGPFLFMDAFLKTEQEFAITVFNANAAEFAQIASQFDQFEACLEHCIPPIIKDLKGAISRPEHESHLRSALAVARDEWLGKWQPSPRNIALTAVDSEPRVPARKGDVSLLQNADGTLKTSVSFRTAENYIGVGTRRVQQLIKDTRLSVYGGGHNKQISVESLLRYLPPENAKRLRKREA
jgi:hypothetical protein